MAADQPLIDLKVQNPVTVLKKWWYGVMSREGLDVHIRVHPVTAIATLLMVGGISFGAGRAFVPKSVQQIIPFLQPTPEPNPWVAAAYSGRLTINGSTYYLVTSTSQAITLELPEKLDLSAYVNKRLLAIGTFNSAIMTLRVTSVSDLQVVTGLQPLHVASASATP
ncbi:MAG TPA: hypothetical protein VLH19_05735 [Patescibacteria group bacterium]|nr:hypothetical protein [Patescibacteria group bacterium]